MSPRLGSGTDKTGRILRPVDNSPRRSPERTLTDRVGDQEATATGALLAPDEAPAAAVSLPDLADRLDALPFFAAASFLEPFLALSSPPVTVLPEPERLSVR